MPAARRVLEEHGVRADDVKATGPGGRLLKEDVLAHLDSERSSQEPARKDEPSKEDSGEREYETREPADRGKRAESAANQTDERQQEIHRMTPLRRTVARRLIEAQRTMAILTTFNEIDMSTVLELRKECQERFQEKHGVRLGILSFFAKAVFAAIREVPRLNAEVQGDNIVEFSYCDLGVAIGSGKGLVVPCLRDADRMSFADMERGIADLAKRAQENRLKPEELEGGTFTITNGGIYGSLLSTPIINPPQSGILGLHAIQDRPVAKSGAVVIRPMMYVALSYDHRIVDGREAVTFLRLVKEYIENPTRMWIES